MADYSTIKDNNILDLFRKTFTKWFRNHVNQLDPSHKHKFLKDFAYGLIF